jgi:hypothetical protein
MLLQSILMSLTSVFSPSDLQIILDTKCFFPKAPRCRCYFYVEDALSSLNWCVNEMERYAMMAQDRSAKFPKIVAVVMSLLI